MTFTQFLRRTHPTESMPSFLDLARNDAMWPEESDRLEDFESFILARLQEDSQQVIPELRGLWDDYADEVGRSAGKHDLDLALAAWSDYARHLQTCAGSAIEACETAKQLLEKAISESNFDDLDYPMRAALPCEGVDEKVDAESDDGDLGDFDDDDQGEWEQPADQS
jgi:hypothetical protein